MEVSVEALPSASMEASICFHGSNLPSWKLVEVDGNFHGPRLKKPNKQCESFHHHIFTLSIYFLPWKFPPAPMKASVEVNGSKLTSMGASTNFQGSNLEVDGSRFTSMKFSGSFHCFHQLQLPRPCSVEASMSLHIPLYTSTYFHECHKTSSCFHKIKQGSTDFHSKVSCAQIYLHGS